MSNSSLRTLSAGFNATKDNRKRRREEYTEEIAGQPERKRQAVELSLREIRQGKESTKGSSKPINRGLRRSSVPKPSREERPRSWI